MAYEFTEKQGQYLAFIYNYTKIHGRAPAEWEIQTHFRTTPASEHQMIVRLHKNGLISRVPGQVRSIVVLVPPEQLPWLK